MKIVFNFIKIPIQKLDWCDTGGNMITNPSFKDLINGQWDAFNSTVCFSNAVLKEQ